jgi:hypothetical protein
MAERQSWAHIKEGSKSCSDNINVAHYEVA